MACVGDDPTSTGADPNVPVGQYRGACTADNKCLQGLECNQGVCLYPDGGAPPDGSGSSSGGSSSGGSSSGDSSTVACPAPNPNNSDPLITCGGAAGCANECCFGASGPAACDATCASIDPRRSIKCDSKYQCTNSGDECCLAVTVAALDTSVCPSPLAFVDVTEAICVNGGCDQSAGSGQYKMCRGDSECTSPKKCRQIEISTGGSGMKAQYGVCN